MSILLLFISFCTSLSFHPQIAKAADITSSISGISGTSPTAIDTATNAPAKISDSKNWSPYDNYQLTYNFTIKDGTNVQKGDTAKVALPAGTKFSSQQSFNIMSLDGKDIVGTFQANAGDNFGTITFSDYFSKNPNKMAGNLSFTIIGSHDPGGGGTGGTSYIGKRGWGQDGTWLDNKPYGLDKNGRYQYVVWDLQVNPDSKSLTDVSINDTLDNLNQETMLPSTLYVTSNSKPATTYKEGTNYAIDYQPNKTDPTSFTIKWLSPTPLKDPVNIEYLSQINKNSPYLQNGSGITLTNTASISGND
ncbi:collagen binding domain protein [Lentilactobacillus diolivorans DSM 14421]|uniref:Collagen binding domain protein n=1 Tax=Lentilactobacillus diolivorans DSM 14421 TaxID=1423739 RepID=A0A0R1SKD0_9LACO|nr:collagen binding domain protein [Lentilactobacillus diolivorans DSM 14421]